MNWKIDESSPIFEQIGRLLENDIFSGIYPAESQVPSTTEISAALHLNPATVLKGINMLVEAGILYKKRGIGMFVTENAKEMIKIKRMVRFKEDYILPLLDEAKRLGLDEANLDKMIKEVKNGN